MTDARDDRTATSYSNVNLKVGTAIQIYKSDVRQDGRFIEAMREGAE